MREAQRVVIPKMCIGIVIPITSYLSGLFAFAEDSGLRDWQWIISSLISEKLQFAAAVLDVVS